jgi:ubiquitin carboxyl-terminal hydrolase L3
MNSNVNWPALESDPEIFSNYAHNVGLSNKHSFNEIFSLDPEMLATTESSAVILCFTYNKSGPERQLDPNNFVDTSTIPYFMKQSGSLDLACGIIAILHCIGNTKVELNDNSILKSFFEKTKNKTAEERATYLETCESFKQAQQKFANQGQSNQPQNAYDCNYHFIAFVHHDGKLYELDGIKKAPYVLNSNCDANIVPLVGSEINKLLEQGVISENFALMFLA